MKPPKGWICVEAHDGAALYFQAHRIAAVRPYPQDPRQTSVWLGGADGTEFVVRTSCAEIMKLIGAQPTVTEQIEELLKMTRGEGAS